MVKRRQEVSIKSNKKPRSPNTKNSIKKSPGKNKKPKSPSRTINIGEYVHGTRERKN
jgi:hypothetical protein